MDVVEGIARRTGKAGRAVGEHRSGLDARPAWHLWRPGAREIQTYIARQTYSAWTDIGYDFSIIDNLALSIIPSRIHAKVENSSLT